LNASRQATISAARSHRFDDILLAEEGRPHLGTVDDYDVFLAEAGHAAEQYLHAMNDNDDPVAPWHLDERLVATRVLVLR
jgi:hypothetical protein